jgi:hypothetical protein
MKMMENQTICGSVVDEVVEEQIAELNELQLALVGGGSGEVVFH